VYLGGARRPLVRREDAIVSAHRAASPGLRTSVLRPFPVERIEHGLRFASTAFFPIDDGIMFVGARRTAATEAKHA
jgi:hypothetical protein